jgi:hypothetical protein
MAQSPFYTPINVQKSDFSGITRAGEAWANAYTQLGQSLGKVVSTYFEEEGKKDQAAQWAKSKAGREFFKSQNMSDEQIDELLKDPKAAGKMVNNAAKAAGGIDKLVGQMEAMYSLKSLKKADHRKNILFKQERDKNNYLLNELDYKDSLFKAERSINKYLNTPGEDGVKPIDRDDPFGGLDMSSRAMQEAAQNVSQNLGIGNYDPRLVSVLYNSLAADNYDEMQGKFLTSKNFENESDLYANIDKLNENPMWRSAPQEFKNAVIERAKGNVDGAGGKDTVRKLFSDGINSTGFGAFKEVMKGNISTFGKLRSMLDTAIITNDDGTIQIKNATAASVALMQTARMAQGSGQLSNKDVDMVSGRKDFKSVIDRFLEKRVGQEMVLTEEMIKNNPEWLRAVNPDTGNPFQAGEKILVGGADMSIDDVILLREIADGMDAASNKFTQKVVPDIYKNVMASYPGFTIEQLNKFTDLHQYMPNGMVNLDPARQVTRGQLEAVKRMKDDGVSKESAFNNIVNSSAADPNSGFDYDADKPAIEYLLDQVYEKNYDPNNSHVNDYMDFQSANYNGKERNLNPDKSEDGPRLSPSEVVDDSSSGATRTIIGAPATYGALSAAERIGQYSLKTDLINKEFIGNNTWKSVQKDISKLKGKALLDNAKNFGVEGVDKMSEKQIRAAIKKNIGDEVKKIAAKEMAEMGIKKSILSKLFVSGTVGAVLFAFDVTQLLSTKDKITVKAATDLAKKYPKGSIERQVADELVNQAKAEFSTFSDAIRGAGAGLLEENNIRENLEARRSAASKITGIKPGKRSTYFDQLLRKFD